MASSDVKKEIVRALSEADIGLAPDDFHFAIASRVLSQLRDGQVIKTYSIAIKQDSPVAPRVMTVTWSSLLNFPSQVLSVRVGDLTTNNLLVGDVMWS